MRTIEVLLLTAFLAGHFFAPFSFSRALISSHASETINVSERETIPAVSPKGSCAIKFLSRLGWKFEGGGNDSKVQFDGKDFCFANNLSELQKEGRNKIILPHDFDNQPEEVKFYLLTDLLNSQASRCLYRIKLSDANNMAAFKLSQNKNLHFSPSDIPGNKNEIANALVDTTATEDWDVESAKSAMHAISSPSKALNSILNPRHHHAVDCYAGAVLESLMAQKELYGDKDFDRAFKNREIIVGGIWVVAAGDENNENPLTAESTFLPPNYDEVKNSGFVDKNGSLTTQEGGHSLLARRGVIASLLGEEFLDNKTDANENLIFVSMNTAAEQELKRIQDPYQYTFRVGASYWIENTKLTLRGWIATKEKKEKFAKALEQFYLKYPDARLWDTASYARELDKNPIFTGIKVYVHPLGVESLSWHWKRLSQLNPANPYVLEMFPTNLMTTMFDRYKNFYIKECR